MRIAVAVSGGRDSTALLHCTARQARALGMEAVALHVNHGLSPQADAWARHVESQCRRWRHRGLPVQAAVQRITTRPPKGASVEAWARRERYQALTKLARSAGCDTVLLAHHRRDQAETVLLQLLRRSHPGALSAMHRLRESNGIRWIRPWIDHSRDAIEAYVTRHRLSYVDDGSNADTRHPRNRLRHVVWPALEAAFPDAEVAVAAMAAQVVKWQAVIAEVIGRDVQNCVDGSARLIQHRWVKLPEARRDLVLNVWLSRISPGLATFALVNRLMRELPEAGSVRWPVRGDTQQRTEVVCYRGVVWVRHVPEPDSMDVESPTCELDLSRPGLHPVEGWGGGLQVELTTGPGVPLHRLAAVQVRPRLGGERFQLSSDRPARALKKQYQAAAVPEWDRAGPLFWIGDQLAFVPGLGVDARVTVSEGPERARLHWRVSSASDSGE